MAYMDKIYGTRDQWWELCHWLAINRPQYVKYLYNPFTQVTSNTRDGVMMISNFPPRADKWLAYYCPLEWVRKRLKEQGYEVY